MGAILLPVFVLLWLTSARKRNRRHVFSLVCLGNVSFANGRGASLGLQVQWQVRLFSLFLSVFVYFLPFGRRWVFLRHVVPWRELTCPWLVPLVLLPWWLLHGFGAFFLAGLWRPGQDRHVYLFFRLWWRRPFAFPWVGGDPLDFSWPCPRLHSFPAFVFLGL